MKPVHILVVRLGAMGDVIHALPAVSTLKRSFPTARITWIVDPKWAPLLAGNPYIDRLLTFNRRSWASIRETWSALRASRFDLALDLQGLIKSALIARASGAAERVGFQRSEAREPFAAAFYTKRVSTAGLHFVDRCIELARACGAADISREFPIPEGRAEGQLPSSRFVLACPLAGWTAKQWPKEHWEDLAAGLRDDGLELVVNGAPGARRELETIRGAHVHTSGIEGLIHATHRASAVIGVDSGPLHLAAALAKPGVAIFGPTDPARNGPYCATMTVLRDPGAQTTYKRGTEIDPAMRAVVPRMVLDALRIRLEFHAARTRG
jgi:heptosyltransferase-1